MSYEPEADERSPDHSVCRHCMQTITWDEICYIHDATGFADCGLTITGGASVAMNDVEISINPDIAVDESYGGACAEPVEWND